jgi:hypothetical protein
MPVVSVDLAYLDYRDFGMVVLEDGSSGAEYQLCQFANSSAQTPTPERVANTIIDACKNVGAALVVLDGPQGWKDPLNGSDHSRLCERLAHTSGKTGFPGNVKPASYLRFFEFAIRVFDAFHLSGWERYSPVTWRVKRLGPSRSFSMILGARDIIVSPAKRASARTEGR